MVKSNLKQGMHIDEIQKTLKEVHSRGSTKSTRELEYFADTGGKTEFI